MNTLPEKPDLNDRTMGTGLLDLTPDEVAFIKSHRSERVAVVSAENLARLLEALEASHRGYLCRKDARERNLRVACVNRISLGAMLQRAAEKQSS